MIALIDYGAGNLASVRKALAALGAQVVVPHDPAELAEAGAVIVPGVRVLPGAFGARHGLGVATALLVKYRDPGTDARVALEGVLR